MSVTSVDFEIVKYLDVGGEVIIEVYKKGDENPMIVDSFYIDELAEDFVDMVCDDSGMITDLDCSEMGYSIVDNLQDAIDFINDRIADVEE